MKWWFAEFLPMSWQGRPRPFGSPSVGLRVKRTGSWDGYANQLGYQWNNRFRHVEQLLYLMYLSMRMSIYTHINIMCIYDIYIYPSSAHEVPPQWDGSPGSTPFTPICKLLAAFLRSSLVFARFWQRFWLPASHLLGTCYLFKRPT